MHVCTKITSKLKFLRHFMSHLFHPKKGYYFRKCAVDIGAPYKISQHKSY